MYYSQGKKLDEVRGMERLQGIAAGLKRIYQSPTEEIARTELEQFAQTWDEKHPQSSRLWNNYAVQAASKKWTMPIQNWKLAMNRFMIKFEERLTPYL